MNPTQKKRKALVDAGVIASILGISTATVNAMDLPHYRVGKRAVRFDVDEVLEALRVPCTDRGPSLEIAS